MKTVEPVAIWEPPSAVQVLALVELGPWAGDWVGSIE